MLLGIATNLQMGSKKLTLGQPTMALVCAFG